MAKFYLDKKEGQESPIFLSLYHRGKRIKVYTGKKIDAAKWDVEACRANPRKYKNNCIGFNQFLQSLDDEVEKLVNTNKAISKSDLKLLVEKASGKQNTHTFYGFAEEYIQKQLAKGDLKPISAKGYRTTLNHLKAVSPNLTFDDVDLNFYDKFVSYLRNKVENDENKGISVNSIGANIKRLKWFMTAAMDRDLHSNVSFKKKAFRALNEATDQIYLTRIEIAQLEKKDMPIRLKRVADTFVINCQLGMRFADLIQIQKSNFIKDGDLYYLHMVQGKTSEKIRIPVPSEALPLLIKYDFNCPIINPKGQLISVQKFNDYLKEAASEAELNTIEDIRTNGQVEKLPKHKLISSHTARRSFATNLYLEGVPIQDIMAITGHKKEQTFLLYVRADQLTKSKGLAKHYQEKNRSVIKLPKKGKSTAG